MKIYNVFFMLWRAWLWISVMFGLIIFSPIALIVIHSYKTYWIFHLFCKYWCRFVLIINGFWYHLNMDSSIDATKAKSVNISSSIGLSYRLFNGFSGIYTLSKFRKQNTIAAFW